MYSILAAFIFFTRLPFWRITQVPSESFKHVVSYWALVGWLTAGLSVFVLYMSSLILPSNIALLLAILTRLLITGCLHEDGLADFFDGFGGGNTKERILSIMKDSHIGSYGVIGLIFYFGLLYTLLNSLPLTILGSIMLVADPFSKGISSMIINYLPYVRKENESKAKIIYNKMSSKELIYCLTATIISLIWLPNLYFLFVLLFPLLIFTILISLMKNKIQGYTGDCCGALFLLCELSFYLGSAIIYHIT